MRGVTQLFLITSLPQAKPFVRWFLAILIDVQRRQEEWPKGGGMPQ